jgi:hypothetical protein
MEIQRKSRRGIVQNCVRLSLFYDLWTMLFSPILCILGLYDSQAKRLIYSEKTRDFSQILGPRSFFGK